MNNDWHDNPAIMVMVEAALLGVIRTHGGGEDECVRLRAAKKALFGIDPPRGKPTDLNQIRPMPDPVPLRLRAGNHGHLLVMSLEPGTPAEIRSDPHDHAAFGCLCPHREQTNLLQLRRSAI